MQRWTELEGIVNTKHTADIRKTTEEVFEAVFGLLGLEQLLDYGLRIHPSNVFKNALVFIVFFMGAPGLRTVRCRFSRGSGDVRVYDSALTAVGVSLARRGDAE